MGDVSAVLGASVCVGALALFALLLTLLIIRGRRQTRRRWAELLGWADTHRWTLVAKPAVDWGSRLPGRNKHGVAFALYGEMWGRRVSVGEYSYTVTSTMGDGSSTSTTHHFVPVVVHLDRPSGYLGVQPRGLFSRWGKSLFGAGSSIGDPRFDKEFQVLGDPATAAYPITAELIAAHVAGAAPPWTLAGAELLTWVPGRLDLARLDQLVGPLYHVARMLTGAVAAR
ncbi:MAG: hypothetical protein QOH97_332 [Actinoplanes sp.]|jgi:hypothetical protein|nr:hypothetical protein [Actinoplanes sp.]